ncbi:hypothetical protein BCR35DRAFT_327739 [Leucosporidium creatinivorum]|uniref:Uncharacterized protein n=1 Tax=Leucosporidium creatinivorum TaxID=106004 RepID=A0A1Y2G521_9BASI|nr:hypothetical protein BCR35DRAFT_327739 [Leucosporidium creatinivorum]
MDTVDSADDRWHREGPCRLLGASSSWSRVNQPRACDMCRKKHGHTCKIGEESYEGTAGAQVIVFVPVLPPPRPPCSTPTEGESGATVFVLDVDAVAERYKVSGTRPAPLVWKSVDELSPSTTTTTSAPIPIRASRSKRPLKTASSDDSSSESPSSSLGGARPLSLPTPPKPSPRSLEHRARAKTPAPRMRKDGEALSEDGLLLAVFKSGSKSASPLGPSALRKSREWFSGRESTTPQKPLQPFAGRFASSSVRDDPPPSQPSALHLTRPRPIATPTPTPSITLTPPTFPSPSHSHLSQSAPAPSSTLARLLNPTTPPSIPSPPAFHPHYLTPPPPAFASYMSQPRQLSWSAGAASDWFDED